MAGSFAILPNLPTDVVQKIFAPLSMLDVCNVAQSSRIFREYTCQLSSLNLLLHNAAPVRVFEKVQSFQSFIMYRTEKGMQVDQLSICHPVPALGHSDALIVIMEIIASCSASLQCLSLSNMWISNFDPQLGLMAAICSCSQLRSISVRVLLGKKITIRESDVMQALLEALPDLRALQFKQCVEKDRSRPVDSKSVEPGFIFGSDMIAQVCAGFLSDSERGLQVLEMDQSDLDDYFVLPSSLRYVYLNNWFGHFRGRCRFLLSDLPLLEELYLVFFEARHFSVTARHADIRLSETLRSAVFHLLDAPIGFYDASGSDDDEELGTHSVPETSEMPNLELLAVTFHNQNVATAYFPKKMSCPKLKELLCQSYLPRATEQELPLLQHLMQKAAPNVEVLQVALCVSSPKEVELFWTALSERKSLRCLNLIFQDLQEQTVDRDVIQVFEGATRVAGLHLPALQQVNIFSVTRQDGSVGPSFRLGSHLANEQGVHGICNAIGKLVDRGVLPFLQQIDLYPVLNEEGVPIYGPGPIPDGAPNVSSAFLQQPHGWALGHSWLKPSCCEPHLQSRAQRTFESVGNSLELLRDSPSTTYSEQRFDIRPRPEPLGPVNIGCLIS